MRNQLLRDTDMMSMAWGVELRVPFLDAAVFATLSADSGCATAGDRQVAAACERCRKFQRGSQTGRSAGSCFLIQQWLETDWAD